MRALNSDPEFKNKKLSGFKKYLSKPEVKWMNSEKFKIMRNKPSFIERMERSLQNPRVEQRRRRAISETYKKRYLSDPEYKKMMDEKTRRASLHDPLTQLTSEQRKICAKLRRKGCPREEAIKKAKAYKGGGIL